MVNKEVGVGRGKDYFRSLKCRVKELSVGW